MNDIERFYSHIDVKGGDDCWEWLIGKAKFGYGKFQVKGKPLLAHRFMWELEQCEIPEGMCVLHRCDNPSCVNPRHLFLGTRQDNIKDMTTKGRSGHPLGELNPNSKLTKDDVIYIRKLFQAGFTLGHISKRYDEVGYENICRIVNNKQWKDVK